MSDKLTRSVDNEVNNETAIKEVQHLLKNGIVDLSPDMVNKLRSKYTDDNVVDAIMETFSERRKKIVNVASIFMDAFQRKYKNEFYSMSLSKFMKRALKYKSKYNLSNDELEEAKKIFEMRIFNSNDGHGVANVVYPNTNLSRVLGYPVTESIDNIKTSNTDDFAYLQNILKLYQLFRSLHSYIVIQTMTYTDIQDEALSGTFSRDRHNINVYVHPVIVALFLPKIKNLEERMLYANIAGIINTRYNSQRIVTKPDYELFYSMVIDPADTICDNISPMRDLESRVQVQIQLWNNVYNLRNGKFYDASSIEFMSYIDKCRISTVDNPDLVYLSDEGVILRRLFSIFSFRPILVQTIPVMGVITTNPLNLPVNMQSITAIPYITYKLPQIPIATKNYSLNDAISQVQYYMENGTFIPKMTQLMDCNGPMVFYVPRRYTALPLSIQAPQISSFNMSNYKNSTRDYQNMLSTAIEFDYPMEITSYGSTNKVQYYLRSAVAYDVHVNSTIILGHIAILVQYSRDGSDQIIHGSPSKIHIYTPRQANLQGSYNSPFRELEETAVIDLISKQGTIFVYATN